MKFSIKSQLKLNLIKFSWIKLILNHLNFYSLNLMSIVYSLFIECKLSELFK
jgi:hypothetical protein